MPGAGDEHHQAVEPQSDARTIRQAVIEGRPTILCGSNNYLGLTFDADCVAAAQQATKEFGTWTLRLGP